MGGVEENAAPGACVLTGGPQRARVRRSIGIGLAIGMLAVAQPAWADDLRPDSFLAPCGLSQNEKYCLFMADKFQKEWKQALRGRIESQRNVAYCLWDGCDGAISTNPVLACAWRMVVIASGSPKIDDLDARNFDIYCKSLSETGRIAADAQARQIIRRTMR